MRTVVAALVLPALLAMIGLSGCAVARSDVTFNPYAPNGPDGSILDKAEKFMDAPFDAINKFDSRFERTVY